MSTLSDRIDRNLRPVPNRLEGPAEEIPLSGRDLVREAPLLDVEQSVTLSAFHKILTETGNNVAASIGLCQDRAQTVLLQTFDEVLGKVPDTVSSKVKAELSGFGPMAMAEIMPNLIVYGLLGVDGERSNRYPLSDKDLLYPDRLGGGQEPTREQLRYYEERTANLPGEILTRVLSEPDTREVSCRVALFSDRLEVSLRDPQGFPKFEEKMANLASVVDEQNLGNLGGGGRGLLYMANFFTAAARSNHDHKTIVLTKTFGAPTIYEQSHQAADDINKER